MASGPEQRLSKREREELAASGYVVRRAVFSPDECASIRAECDDVIERATAEELGRKKAVGSYLFEVDDSALVVKWEPEAPELLQGLEHFDHVSPELARRARDPRLVEPCKDLIGSESLSLFTEKLNLKRARLGGQYVLHQDFPYWENFAHAADRIATAMLFLDGASAENGCLEVAPGSHRRGKLKTRDVPGFAGLEMDTEQFDFSTLVPVEVNAGDVLYFGPFLAHRSLPNRSDKDRRALLYSYQPAGLPHARMLMQAAKGREDILSQ